LAKGMVNITAIKNIDIRAIMTCTSNDF